MPYLQNAIFVLNIPRVCLGIVKLWPVTPLLGNPTPPHSYAERPPLPATAHGWKNPFQRSGCGWAGVPAFFPVIASEGIPPLVSGLIRRLSGEKKKFDDWLIQF